MLRLMIDAQHQGRGHGQAAVRLAIAWARQRHNNCFQTSADPENQAALGFYRSLGLRETGRIVEGEVEMSMDLAP